MAWYDSVRGDRFNWAELGIGFGLYPSISRVFVPAFNADLPTTEVTLWDRPEIYTYPDLPEAFTVSSDSVEDNPSGAGASGVVVEGLDENWATQILAVDLNGQTPVALGDGVRHQKSVITGEQDPDGTIYIGTGTVTAGVPAVIYGQINPGNNRSLQSVYTVPRGSKAILTGALLSSGRSQASTLFSSFMVRPFGGVFVRNTPIEVHSQGGLYSLTDVISQSLGEKTDIEVRVVSGTAGLDLSASYNMVQIV